MQYRQEVPLTVFTLGTPSVTLMNYATCILIMLINFKQEITDFIVGDFNVDITGANIHTAMTYSNQPHATPHK